MVRLLSLLIVLLVPNLFAPRAPERVVRHRHAPPASTPAAPLARAGSDRAPAKAGWRAGDPDLAQAEPVPTRLTPERADPEPREHPTLEPSLEP